MDFVESLAIRLPDIEAQLREADLRESAGLVIEVAAIHEGVTQNFNRYPALELASSLPTWTSPYQKAPHIFASRWRSPMLRLLRR